MPESTISMEQLRALILSLLNEPEQEGTLGDHEVRITALEEGGGGGPAPVIFANPEANPLVLTAEQTGSIIVSSDGAQEVRLPTSADGLVFTFVCGKGGANTLKIRCSNADEGEDAVIVLNGAEVWSAYTDVMGASLTLVGTSSHPFLGEARRWYATSAVLPANWVETPV